MSVMFWAKPYENAPQSRISGGPQTLTTHQELVELLECWCTDARGVDFVTTCIDSRVAELLPLLARARTLEICVHGHRGVGPDIFTPFIASMGPYESKIHILRFYNLYHVLGDVEVLAELTRLKHVECIALHDRGYITGMEEVRMEYGQYALVSVLPKFPLLRTFHMLNHTWAGVLENLYDTIPECLCLVDVQPGQANGKLQKLIRQRSMWNGSRMLRILLILLMPIHLPARRGGPTPYLPPEHVRMLATFLY